VTFTIPLVVHETHVRVLGASGDECRNCWACTCHSPDIFVKPCKNSVEIEAHPQAIIDSVARQSARYGQMIRDLDAAGAAMRDDLFRVKKAWTAYRNQLHGTTLLEIARAGYYNLYGA